MVFEKPVREIELIKWVGFTLVFMLLMFSRDFGNIYMAMVVVWFVFYYADKHIFDKKVKYPIEKSANARIESIFISVVTYAIFLMISTILMVTFIPNSLPNATLDNINFANSAKEVAKIMGTGIVQASAPILRESKILLFIGWGILIPIVETVLFNGKVFEAIGDRLRNHGFSMNKLTNVTLIVLLVTIAAVTALYHLTAKSADSVQLMVTFVFFFISGVLVVWRGHLREAILVHIIGNSIAVLNMAGAV